MMPSIINQIGVHPPAAGHRISFFRLDGTESYDLLEVYELAGALAAALRGLGVGRGDRIGILAPNTLEWVLLDLAALRLGAVTVGFDPAKFDVDSALISRYGLRMLFAGQVSGPAGVRSVGELRRLAGQLGEPPPPVTYAPDEPTTLKLTSGSTGEPKGLTASAGSIDSSLHAVQEMFGHGRADNLFVFLPLSVLQQRYWIYSALYFGHDVTVSTYEAAFAAMGRARPTVVMGVPGFFETAKKYLEARPDPVAAATALFGDRIRYLWTGSAPASADLLRFFTGLGLAIFEGYGLNETCIVSKNHPGAHRPGSVGKVLRDKRVLLDADGVISVRNDHPVATRYEYAPPGVSDRIFGTAGGAGVTVRTGDLGYLDEDGFLFILGRSDDVIVLDNGRKIIVRPLEEHMKASPAIEECVLFCPRQTQLVAVVSPAGEPADEAAIATQLASTNATFGRDEQISRVVVARDRFSIENDLLSSQLKPRRARILDAYRTEIYDYQGSNHAR